MRLEPPDEGLANLVLPLDPMIGCFGVTPRLGQAFSTATSAENGGNMDYRGFGPGATVWFPVAVKNALFFLGDCHAIQGDGEIVGTGVETCYDVALELTVRKENRKLVWPRGENGEEIFSIGFMPARSTRRCSMPLAKWSAGSQANRGYPSRRQPPAWPGGALRDRQRLRSGLHHMV